MNRRLFKSLKIFYTYKKTKIMKLQTFNPTHFIEQYNATDYYKSDESPNEYFTGLIPIEYLSDRENFMKTEIKALFTVAIFKIQFKDAAKN